MSAGNPKEWRLENASRLKGAQLQFRRYTRWSEAWDHDHCSACWAKLAEFDGPDIQHEGYATGGKRGTGYEWICCECFEDLKSDLGWTAAPKPGSSTAC
jgi:hypothetical protein